MAENIKKFKFRKIALYGPAGCGKDHTAKALTELIFHTKYSSELWKENFYQFSFAKPLKKIMMDAFNLSEDMVTEEYYKNNVWVNLYTMEIDTTYIPHMHSFPEGIHDKKNGFLKIPIKACKLFQKLIVSGMSLEMENQSYNINFMMTKMKCEYVMTIRELLVYFGTYIMRNFISDKIWINMSFNNPDYINAENHNLMIINSDLRFPSEYERLKKEGYCFIKIIPEWQKSRKTDNGSEKVNNIAESFYDKFTPDYEFHNYNCSDDLYDFEQETYWKSLCLLGFFIIDGIRYEDLDLFPYREEFDLHTLNSNFIEIFNNWKNSLWKNNS